MIYNQPKPIIPVLKGNLSIAKGLVIWLPFIEKGGTIIRDYSGNNYHCTIGGTGVGTWYKSPYGSSWGTIGDGTYALTTKTFPISGNATRTILLRFKKDVATVEMNPFSWGTWSSNAAFACRVPGTDVWSVHCYANDFNSTIAIDLNWHTVILEYNSANNTATYILDGAVTQSQVMTALNTAATVLRLGRRPDDYAAMNGQIAEFAVWNRILTHTEKRLIQKPLFYPLRKQFIGRVQDFIPPVLSNLTVTTGTNDGELNISFDYSEETTTVPECEIAIARINTDLPSGAYTGKEDDDLTYNVFKPIYKTVSIELAAMANNASGTYSCTLKLPDNGKVYVTVSAKDASNNWANWMTPVSGTVKGTGGIVGGSWTWG